MVAPQRSQKIPMVPLSDLYYRLVDDDSRRFLRRHLQLAPAYGKSLAIHFFAILLLTLMMPDWLPSSQRVFFVNPRLNANIDDGASTTNEIDLAVATEDFNGEIKIATDADVVAPMRSTMAETPMGVGEMPIFPTAEFIDDERERLATAEIILPTQKLSAIDANRLSGKLLTPISRGLAYLAKTQEDDGGWRPLKYEGRGDGEIVATSLALLAFANDVASSLDGRKREVIRKARNFLLAKWAEHDKSIADAEWGAALWALAASTEKSSAEWRNQSPMRQMQQALLRAQNVEGGWSDKYARGGNLLIGSVVISALAEAARGGIKVDADAAKLCEKYLTRVSPAEKAGRRRRGIYREGSAEEWQQPIATALALGAWERFAEIRINDGARKIGSSSAKTSQDYEREIAENLSYKRWWFGATGTVSFFAAYFQVRGLTAFDDEFRARSIIEQTVVKEIIDAQNNNAGNSPATKFANGSWSLATDAPAGELSLGRIGATALAILTLQTAAADK